MLGATLFASNISTIHLVGLPASGFNEGLVCGNFEWMVSFTLILLSLVFAPFYFRSLPEFLEKRYSPASRSLLAFMAILAAYSHWDDPLRSSWLFFSSSLALV